jgi:cytochrome b561/polyisoprenoid-binding protein YceI
MTTPARRYSAVAVVLHWLTAAAIVVQLILALRMQGPRSPETFAVFQLHKSVGVTILALTVLRLAWRLTHRPPPEPATLAGWERRLAQLTHAGFYLLLVALPLTGWIMVSASELAIPTRLYGVLPFPDLPGFADAGAGARAGWREAGEVAHAALAVTLLALLALHVAGALKHQLFAADEPVFGRMAPGARAGRKLEPRLALVAFGAIAAAGLGWSVRPPTAPPPRASPPATPPRGDQPLPPSTAAPPSQTAAPTAAPRWNVQDGSRIGFRTAWGEQPVEGRFTRWRSQIHFDPDALDRSRVTATFDLASVDTGDAQRDAALASPDWLDVAGVREATYTATRFERTGADTYVAHGELSLRGVRRSVPLRFMLKIQGDEARLTGRARLDRLAFGVGRGEFAATDQIPAEVDVQIALTARREARS